MTNDDQLRHLVTRSVQVIAEHQDVGGAYLASPTFPVYRFSWLRDGAFIADAMSRVGETGSAERFFDWCARTLLDRQEHIRSLVRRAERGEAVPPRDHPPTRFTVDGADSGEEWWDFQLDGYGTWIWALGEHRRRHGREPLAGDVLAAVELCVDYLAAFWSDPCYDWWEEHADRVHTSTLASLGAGMRAAIDLGVAPGCRATAAATLAELDETVVSRCVADGRLVKMTGDTRVDASLIAACGMFGTLRGHDDVAEATYDRIVADLAPDGVHRYLGDTYFGGGRWVVLAGFVGWHEATTGRDERARARLEWMSAQATPDGLLPEQTTDHVLDPSFISVWVDKWGPVATPLLWSHAMYITLADALGLADHHRPHDSEVPS